MWEGIEPLGEHHSSIENHELCDELMPLDSEAAATEVFEHWSANWVSTAAQTNWNNVSWLKCNECNQLAIGHRLINKFYAKPVTVIRSRLHIPRSIVTKQAVMIAAIVFC